MIRTAFVHIWGKRAGAVAWDETRELATFEYDPAFKALGWDLAPLTMPIESDRRIFSFPELRKKEDPELDAFKGLPGLLADSLPDNYGNQLINVWLSRQGRPQNSMNPVEKLCFIGKRGMGALEFEPAQLQDRSGSFEVELNSLVNMAKAMLTKREAFSANINQEQEKAMQQILRIGTSAGGARPKAVIAYNENTGEVRSGQAETEKGFDHWIIKLDGVSDVQLGTSKGWGRVEMAYYKMARDCGIQMMPSTLLEESGRAHFMTRRFDRDSSGVKHHIQTWCAIRHADYNDVRSYSYEQLFQSMRELRLSYPEAEEMYRRMVFNVLARNCDDHTKNFSFRLKKGEKWELAPAYDLCHAYRPDSMWVSQHSLSVNGKREHITRKDLLEVADSMNIKRAESIIRDINKVVSHWMDYAEKVKVPGELKSTIESTLIRL